MHADFCIVEDILATPQARRKMSRIPGTTVFVRLHCTQDVCEARNSLRPGPKRVPTEYLKRYFTELENMPGRAGPADHSVDVSQVRASDGASVLEDILRRACADTEKVLSQENCNTTTKNETAKTYNSANDLEARSR